MWRSGFINHIPVLKKKKILFIVAHRPGRSPGQRFRFEQYLRYFEQSGFECTYSYIISEKDDTIFYSKGHYLKKFLILLKSIFIRLSDLKKAQNFDIIYIYREALMLGSTLFERKFKKKGVKIILDYDDAIWLPDVSNANSNLSWLKNPLKTVTIARLSDMIFAGNNFLATFARAYNSNVKVVPTTLDTSIYNATIHEKKANNVVCIGWTGSLTTLKHFELAIPIFKELAKKYPEKLRFKMIADIPFVTDIVSVDFCKWSQENEVVDLMDIDIGIMPLPDNDWAKGKCGFKGLQYMALGIPTVMSPVGVNSEIINNGINGFLASSHQEWIEQLSKLIESEELRLQLGENGRQTVEEKFSVNVWRDQYIAYFNELLT